MKEKLTGKESSRPRRVSLRSVSPDRLIDSTKGPVIHKIVTGRELRATTGDKPEDQRTGKGSTGSSGAERAGKREPATEGTQPPGKPPEGRVPSAGENGEDEPERMATPKQLANLYRDAKKWIDAQGKIVVEDKSTAGLYKGLPIKGHPPHIDYDIPGDIVRQVTPEAAETLEVGDNVNIAHMLPHYSPLMEPGKYQYNQEELWFGIDKPSDHVLASESLIIAVQMDPAGSGEPVGINIPEFVSDRWTEAATLRTDEVTDDMDFIEQVATVRDFEGQALSRQVGGHLMTQREHQALTDIVNNLDTMRRKKEGITDE